MQEVQLIKRVVDGKAYKVIADTNQLTIEWLLAHPIHDNCVYLHHCGGLVLEYKGFSIEVRGEQRTVLDDEVIHKQPEIILAYKDSDRLFYGDECWIEIIDITDPDEQYENVVGSVKEAVAMIDEIVATTEEPEVILQEVTLKVGEVEFQDIVELLSTENLKLDGASKITLIKGEAK